MTYTLTTLCKQRTQSKNPFLYYQRMHMLNMYGTTRDHSSTAATIKHPSKHPNLFPYKRRRIPSQLQHYNNSSTVYIPRRINTLLNTSQPISSSSFQTKPPLNYPTNPTRLIHHNSRARHSLPACRLSQPAPGIPQTSRGVQKPSTPSIYCIYLYYNIFVLPLTSCSFSVVFVAPLSFSLFLSVCLDFSLSASFCPSLSLINVLS